MELKTQAKAEVMDLTLVCQSFPRLHVPLIPRDNILDTIERMFEGEIELVVIEGREDLGKTTLLAQFARRHPNHTFSVFIKPASSFGYDPASVRYDLCCQLLWVLRPDQLCKPEEVDDGYLRNRLLELRRHARRETYYFVIDGLADIPDEGIRGNILDMLPMGQGFYFLLSGDLNLLSSRVRQRVECKSCQMVSFSLDETMKYFTDLSLNQDMVEKLYQACGRGIPGHLASARRNILAGRAPETLVKDKLTDLFEEEWNQVHNDHQALQVLAVIAHAKHRPTVEELARLLGKAKEQVQAMIAKLTFLTIDDRTSEVTFVSESSCKFATDKLWNRRDHVIDLIINDLMARPETEVAINHLPIYLEQRGKLNEVLECLSPEYFAKIVEHSQSLIPVRQKADLGISTAMRLFRDGELMRFSMQKSAIADLERAEIGRSEIEALMALNDYTGAMNLAQSMLLKEDRLHLLAVIAKSRREQGQPAEAELLQQIRALYEQVKPMNLGDRAVDIAADLFYSCPDLAIDLVEQTTWTEADENALDLAYTKLSLAALSTPKLTSEPHDKIEAIRARIKNPKLRSFSAAVSLVVRNQTAQEVIAEVNKINTTEDRLLLLRQWAVENRKRPDAADVVDYALDLAIKTTAYAPNTRVLRELAVPLPFMEDEKRAKRLVGALDSQKDTVEHVGPTEDYVRLQLLLARTEKKYDNEACRNRIVDVYLYIYGIDDLAVKASCLARLLAALDRIDPDGEIDAKDQIRSLTTPDLNSSVDKLLQETAEHYHVTRSIVEALAISNPGMALDLATRLNTQERRDAAILNLVDRMVNTKLEEIDINIIDHALMSFVDLNARDEAIIKIIERFSLERNCPRSTLQKVLPFINRISEIGSSRQRCRACCLSYSLLSLCNESGEYNSMRGHLLSLLKESWQNIDVGWTKVDTGFRIVRSFAEHAPELAHEYLGQAESVRKEIACNASAAARTYRKCLQLVVRASAGLLLRIVCLICGH